MEENKPELQGPIDPHPTTNSEAAVLPPNTHIDEQGRVLVPRELTSSEKRMRALYEKKYGSSITIYEVRGQID